MKTITYDALEVRTHASREALGEAAAVVAAETIREACDLRGEARVIFACALSQDEFLAALVRQSVAWNQVTIFHMDEYVGLRATHPQSIRHFLRAHLLDHIARPRAVHLIQGEKDPVHECAPLRQAARGKADRFRLHGDRRKWPPRVQRSAGRGFQRPAARENCRAR
nr:6-phosphogluconolactonase [Chthoniobacter flavus]